MCNQEKRVVIVQSTVRHYRACFFSALPERLARDQINLRVIYSAPNPQQARKCDCVDLNSGLGIKVRADWIFPNRVVYQHAWRHLADAHLVVVEHASKHLLSYLLFASRAVSPRKVALWGHGFNQNGSRLGEILRRRMLRLPDWWFAYTGATLRYLLAQGVPAEITTNVQNAIDTNALARAANRISLDQIDAMRKRLGISAPARVGLFCGSLYTPKRLPMLIASSAIVKCAVPNFHLVVVGAGPERSVVENAARKQPWIHYVGPKFDDERAPYFRIADLVLNPGMVGLGILDAFAVGLPVLTTDIPIHCPEIEYLEDGRNGIVTRHNPAEFAQAVVRTLSNDDLRGRLRDGARISGRSYTLSNMVGNFARGVNACLESK